MTGWATALAVGAPWPVLALRWDADRGGCTLASGFRRPVGYVWLANGTPAGEDEAMRTFAARLALDPVLDVQSLDHPTKPDPASDARARPRGLLAVLTRVGLDLPAGLAPCEPTDRLREVARDRPGPRPIEWEGRQTVRGELEGGAGRRLTPWPPGPATRRPAPWPWPRWRLASRWQPGVCDTAAEAGSQRERCCWRTGRSGCRTT